MYGKIVGIRGRARYASPAATVQGHRSERTRTPHNMILRRIPTLTAVLVAVIATCPVSAGEAASDVSPCERLNANQVKYPTSGAGRVTFAIAEAYNDTRVVLTGCVKNGTGYDQEWQAAGHTGSSGFGQPGLIQVDSLLSPTGSFTVTEAFGRENPGTKLQYRTLNPGSRWGADGPNYNKYFEGQSTSRDDENLWKMMKSGDYEQVAVINYNRPPDMTPTANASYAIFLHAGNKETWGCISTDLNIVTRFLRTAVPGDRMVMGVNSEIFDTPAAQPIVPTPIVLLAPLAIVAALSIWLARSRSRRTTALGSGRQ
ncbi:MAG: repeat protein [Arthrobacter sp.]|nr:repeat protein [Arthrobacter sp.]